MQCGSYFLDAPMSRERNMDASGSTCTSCRRDTGFENEHYNNSLIQPQYINYGKDLIKNTMLQQEAILMNQVAELHRLYEIQTVIMDEFRSRERAKVDNSVQNYLCSERPLDKNPQEMINSPKMLFSSSPITIDYKGKKKMLDLSLPASEYMNCEERELYEQDEALKFPENQDSAVVLPLNHCCEVESFSDVLTAPEHSSSRLAALFDLNKPYQPNQVDIPSASFQGFFSNSHTRPGLDDCSKYLAEENQEKLPTGNYESGEPGSNMNLFGSEMLTVSLESPHHGANEALELPVFCCLNQSKESLDEKTPRSVEAPDRKQRLLKEKSMKKIKPPKIPNSREIVPYQPNPESSVVTMRMYVNNVERHPIVIQALPCFSKQSLYKKRKCKSSWDFLAPGDLKGPISPENEESSRPRGDLTEKEIESGANEHMSKQEAEARQAAEAIVSISSSKVQAWQNNGKPDSSANCNADSLFLFAGIASSSSSKDGLPNYLNGINPDQELDFFEMVTLELPETKVGESLFIKKNYKEENPDASSTMQKTERKGRGSIGKKQLKNFQTELLPSIASLSRQEMKEDLQAIENLRAVTSVSKNGKLPARRKRRRKSWALNLVDELKLLERMHEMSCLEEGLPGWGKVHKRRRLPRFAATNPSPIIVTKV